MREIINHEGKFTIKMGEGKFIIDEWQGETREFSVKRIPVNEIAACLQWLSAGELLELTAMIGARRYRVARAYALKWEWIITS